MNQKLSSKVPKCLPKSNLCRYISSGRKVSLVLSFKFWLQWCPGKVFDFLTCNNWFNLDFSRFMTKDQLTSTNMIWYLVVEMLIVLWYNSNFNNMLWDVKVEVAVDFILRRINHWISIWYSTLLYHIYFWIIHKYKEHVCDWWDALECLSLWYDSNCSRMIWNVQV